MKAVAAGSVFGLKAVSAVKLAWALPVLAITALFASKDLSVLQLHNAPSDPPISRDYDETWRRSQEGFVPADVTASYFKVTVKGENRDILKMTPKAMALQIEQLREIAEKYNSANKRLMVEKSQLTEEKERLLVQVSTGGDLSPGGESGAADGDGMANQGDGEGSEGGGGADGGGSEGRGREGGGSAGSGGSEADVGKGGTLQKAGELKPTEAEVKLLAKVRELETKLSAKAREVDTKLSAKVREVETKLSASKDHLDIEKTEHLSTKALVDQLKDQLRQEESVAEVKAKELKLAQEELKVVRQELKITQQELESVRSAATVKEGLIESTQGNPAVKTADALLPALTPAGGERSWQGYGCSASEEEMKRYLDYLPGKSCPNDWFFVQRLIFRKKCFALPQRWCRMATPKRPAEPLPYPQSLFDPKTLKNRNLRWDLHQYKSFDELNARAAGDCNGCFNLTLDEGRWSKPYPGSVSMKEVVEMKKGTLRLGLDVNGGAGSFAAHMARYGVTVMTTAQNVESVKGSSAKGSNAGLPFMEVISARGLIPLHLPYDARLPLYHGVLDLVHSLRGINGISFDSFQDVLFEWDRVLRPGGIIWLELFSAPAVEMTKFTVIIEKLRFKKLHWRTSSRAAEGGSEGEIIVLNCVLEKQPTPGVNFLTGPLEVDLQDR